MEEIKVSRCRDVRHELEKAGIVFKTEAKNLNFEVVGVTTFIKNKHTEEEKTLTAEVANEFFASREYEEDGWEVSQVYDLLIKYDTCHINSYKNTYEFILENEASEFYLLCTQETYEEFLGDLHLAKKIIDMHKALMGVTFMEFGPIFDEGALRERFLQAQEWFGARKKILLQKSLFFAPVKDSHFFFTVQKNWEFSHNESLDSSLYAVKTGSEVGRLYKANAGNDGRNLLNEFITIQKREPEELKFGILGDDFRVEELEDCNVYYALKDGFVGQNSSGLVLVKDFRFDEINHRNMGNLLGGMECGFEISARASSVDKDAVGSGIVIEALKVRIDGSVDQGVVIRCNECKISGSIHQGAEIFAQSAEIGTHKGKLQANQVKVKVCERGAVDCEEGEFGEVMGAEIYCKNAKIGHLYANNKIFFCQNLEVREFCRGGNLLTIDSSSFLSYREEIQRIRKRQQKVFAMIEKLQKIYRQELLQVKKMRPAVEQFKVIFSKNMQQGVQTQPYILSTIGEYIGLCRRLKKIKAKIKGYEEQLQTIEFELEPISKMSLEARIDTHTPWVEENKVVYVNVAKGIEESLIVENGEKANIAIDPQYLKLIKERIK